MEKRFIVDVLVGPENLCNLQKEKNSILKGIKLGEKLVVYGRRNTGKTSLIKNTIIPEFLKSNKDAIAIFSDFMLAKDEITLARILQKSLERALNTKFRTKLALKSTLKALKSLRPKIQVDPLSGESSIGLSIDNSSISLEDVLENVLIMAKQFKTLIVFDEFQDIGQVPRAQAILRQFLQELSQTPVIMLGSKKHLLRELFTKPMAPLADMAKDIEFKEIPYEEYFLYMRERLEKSFIQVDLDISIFWQDLMFKNPEGINTLGLYLVEHEKNITLTKEKILTTLHLVVEERISRYAQTLAGVSKTEEEVLTMIAKNGPIIHPTSKSFLKLLTSSQRTVSKSISRLLNLGFIEETNKGLQLTSPLFCFYLRFYR